MTDENHRPYILLKDADDVLCWRPYGGEPIEQIRKFHKWEVEAQKKFSSEQRSHEEIDYLRNLLMSMTLVSDFFEFDENMKQDMIGEILAKLSIQWYCKDKNENLTTFNPQEHLDELQPYYNLVMFYVTSFFTTIQEVAQRTGA